MIDIPFKSIFVCEHSPQMFSIIDRTGLLDDALKIAQAQMSSYSTVLDLIQYLKSERDYLPWKRIIQYLKVVSLYMRENKDEQLWRVSETNMHTT